MPSLLLAAFPTIDHSQAIGSHLLVYDPPHHSPPHSHQLFLCVQIMQYPHESILLPFLFFKSWGQDLPFRAIHLSNFPTRRSLSNDCCNILIASSTSFCSFLSSLCECERRPPIKSHLKASLPSPCASCVPCFLSINSTTLRGTAAARLPSQHGLHSACPHNTFIFWCMCVYYILCLCVHVSMCSHFCMCMWERWIFRDCTITENKSSH